MTLGEFRNKTKNYPDSTVIFIDGLFPMYSELRLESDRVFVAPKGGMKYEDYSGGTSESTDKPTNRSTNENNGEPTESAETTESASEESSNSSQG